MRYTLFGRAGPRVFELALSTGTFGTAWGWGSERGEARAAFDGFAEAADTFHDWSDVDQFGQAEQMQGEFIAADLTNSFSQLKSRPARIASTVVSDRTCTCSGAPSSGARRVITLPFRRRLHETDRTRDRRLPAHGGRRRHRSAFETLRLPTHGDQGGRRHAYDPLRRIALSSFAQRRPEPIAVDLVKFGVERREPV